MRLVQVALVLAATSGLADTLYAQRDDIVVDDAATVALDPSVARLQALWDAREQAAARAAHLRAIGFADPVVKDEDRIYQWVLGSRNTEATTKQLEANLRLKIDQLVYLCAANEEQIKALELAARVDMWRFYQRIDELKRQGETRFDEVPRQAQRLRAVLNAGLFGNGSMFAKSVRTVLTPEQLRQFEQVNGMEPHLKENGFLHDADLPSRTSKRQ